MASHSLVRLRAVLARPSLTIRGYEVRYGGYENPLSDVRPSHCVLTLPYRVVRTCAFGAISLVSNEPMAMLSCPAPLHVFAPFDIYRSSATHGTPCADPDSSRKPYITRILHLREDKSVACSPAAKVLSPVPSSTQSCSQQSRRPAGALWERPTRMPPSSLLRTGLRGSHMILFSGYVSVVVTIFVGAFLTVRTDYQLCDQPVPNLWLDISLQLVKLIAASSASVDRPHRLRLGERRPYRGVDRRHRARPAEHVVRPGLQIVHYRRTLYG